MRRPPVLAAALLVGLLPTLPASAAPASAAPASAAPASAAERRAAPEPVLVVAPVVPVGEPVELVGLLPGAGEGRRVVVQQRRGGDWSVVARTRTASRGVFEVRLEESEQRVHRYRAVVRRSPDGPRARTRPALTRVAPRVEEITAGLVDSEAYGDHNSLDVSADGRFVSWDSRGGDPDVFVWDRTRQRLALISPRTSQKTWGGSLSADGSVAAVSTYNSAIRPDQPGRTDYAFPGLVDLRAGLFAPLVGKDGRIGEGLDPQLSDDATRLLVTSPHKGFGLTQLVRGKRWWIPERGTDERAERPVLAAGGRHVAWVLQGEPDPVTSQRRARLMLWEQGSGRRELEVPGRAAFAPVGLSADGGLVLLEAGRPGSEGSTAAYDLLLVSTDTGLVRDLTGDLPRGAYGGVLADDGSLVHVGTWEGPFVYDTSTGRREPASPAPAFLDELDVASGDGSVLVHEDGPTITTYMPVLP
ncbi:hypothetical protein [uncultured Nocardioides sp.]|uniref:hypothetical protein n=1 Tax=uncultured Nocardioides sp. TaxID=198441 RepID=UPI002635F9C8|nr:hypothetical protein [uncultured Nocardioides sp.]